MPLPSLVGAYPVLAGETQCRNGGAKHDLHGLSPRLRPRLSGSRFASERTALCDGGRLASCVDVDNLAYGQFNYAQMAAIGTRVSFQSDSDLPKQRSVAAFSTRIHRADAAPLHPQRRETGSHTAFSARRSASPAGQRTATSLPSSLSSHGPTCAGRSISCAITPWQVSRRG
jgi:hypothetical protein